MNANEPAPAGVRHSGFVIDSKFGIRISTFRETSGFTILELLIVISIIIILAALILGTVGYVQKKAARSRAEAEIAAISAACESYKADNGIYPNSSDTNALLSTDGVPTDYWKASFYLYSALTGDTAGSGGPPAAGQKTYMSFKPASLGRGDMTTPPSGGNPVKYIRDPFGNSYGYSTAKNPDANPGNALTATGYNPTFDLWSSGGGMTALPKDTAGWIKNW